VTGAAVPAVATAAPPGWQALSPRAQFRRWWQNRLPLTDTWQLGQRNIYILPTRAGFTFAATLLVMLVASINYQLNLGYALTFLLAGAGLVSMHMTHGNLRGLTLHLRPSASVHAGQAALLEVVITNPGRERPALALRFEDGRSNGHAGPAPRGFQGCDAPAQGQASAHLSIVPPHRGWHAVPTLVVETVFPFGLFRAWTVWRPAGRVLAWPRPETPPPPLPAGDSTQGDERAARRGAGSELDGVRPWRRGDTMRLVVWKKVARSGELVSRETAGTASRELWLHWADASGSDKEQRLARIAAWVLLAEREGIAYGLDLPGAELPPGQGELQRRAALDLLAQQP
jgi:uncharacterized protein (DUF58 family)